MKKYIIGIGAICGLFAVMIISSCSKDDDDVVFGGVTLGKYESRLEVPDMQKSGTLFIHHSVKIGSDSVMTYCMEYNPTKNHSRWVAFRFDGKTRAIGSGRSNAWADDPSLPSQYQVGNGTWRDYERGHLCASYDRQYDLTANQQTFYMSNMSPMLSSFNGNYWTTFESYVQNKGRSADFADTLYVVKGGTIENTMTQGTVTSSGVRNTTTGKYTISQKSIVIPKYYFIALLRFKAGKYSAIGFWVEHKDYGYSGNNKAPQSVLGDKACNIDYLEDKTGIDFFHNLPDDVEKSVESEDLETLKEVWGI